MKLGIIPAVISPFVLAKIGASHARALFLTGERFDARPTPKRSVSVHQVVPAADLDQAIEGKNLRSCARPARRRRLRREALVRRVLDNSYSESRAITTQAIAKQRVTPEGQEGLPRVSRDAPRNSARAVTLSGVEG